MLARLEQLKKQTDGQYWAQRILHELTYLSNLLGEDDALGASLTRLEAQHAQTGAIVKQSVLAEEGALARFGAQAKSLTLTCAAHAHIDMNWMWSMPETVGVVIDTFQTMLDLMDAYPAFTFTQSQASTYEIVEKFAPSLLEPIKKRVEEGRWEVAATHWVEPDKNMISAESMARHLLYTKRYLSHLLDVDPAGLDLDFEPDGFGHPPGVPEVLSHAGVKYMYHCRGNEDEEIYRWRAPSGAEVLAYREPNWYNNVIEYGMTAFLPAFCRRNHVSAALKVYGVGDHGGGPTRRDIERLTEMQSWPLLPSVRFGRVDEYFHAIEKSRDQFPVVERELNFVFTGCYTSQSRIKRGNRTGEDHLYDAEALHSMARLAGCEPKPAADFTRAWKNVLFNHFHDILPGSGLRDTREYALGLYQEADSAAAGGMNRAMQAIAGAVDTTALGMPADTAESVSEGAGAGHGAVKGAKLEYDGFTTYSNVSDVSRGVGDVRAFVVFNTTQYARKDRVRLTLWDWELPMLQTSVYSADLKELPFDILESDQRYWAHRYAAIAFDAEVPAFGYTTVYVAKAKGERPAPYQENTRVQHLNKGNPVLENERVRAEFDRCSLTLLSFTDKRTGRELLSAPARFRLVEEENAGFFSAWDIGRYGRVCDIHGENFVRLRELKTEQAFDRLAYELSFNRSTLLARLTLCADTLRFSLELDWREESGENKPVPQLQLYVPYAYKADCIRCDA
ncbi:MAG: alpha-mannosidase, partial [Bacillota bacterium]